MLTSICRQRKPFILADKQKKVKDIIEVPTEHKNRGADGGAQ